MRATLAACLLAGALPWAAAGARASAPIPPSGPAPSAPSAASEQATTAPPGEARLSVALTPKGPTVGDRVAATLVLSGLASDAAEPRFPVWQGEWGDAEIVDVRPPARAGDTWRQQLVLAFFAPGERVLPAVSVQLPGPATTRTVSLAGPVTVTVRSVLPEGEDVEPAPPAPPRPVPLGAAFLWMAAGLALCCLAAAVILARRGPGGTRSSAPASRVPPLEELLARLAELDPEDDPARAWERATVALRAFLARTLRFPALESTTLQIQRALSGPLTADLSLGIVRLLRAADQIKFARGTASTADAREAIARSGELAREVERCLRPETVTGEEAA